MLQGPMVPQSPCFSSVTFKLFSKEDTLRMLVQHMMVPTEAHTLSIDKVCVGGLEFSLLLFLPLESFKPLSCSLSLLYKQNCQCQRQ